MADEVLAAPSPEKNLPTLSLTLRQKETKEVANMKPGDPIRVEVQGILKSVELREPYMESSDDFVGSISVECNSIVAEKPSKEDNSTNEFSEMAD